MITITQLRETVSRLQKAGYDISISWAYGKPRCYDKAEARELSPRLNRSQMAIWLEGFESGVWHGYEKGIQDEKKFQKAWA